MGLRAHGGSIMSEEVEPEEEEVYEGEEIRLSIMIGGEAGTGIVSARTLP